MPRQAQTPGSAYLRERLQTGDPLTRSVAQIAGAGCRELARFVGRLGFGRQGALASARRTFEVRARNPARRAVSLFLGSGLIGSSIALLTQADLGLPPYDVLVSGLMPRIGLSFGQTAWVVAACFFVVAAILGERPNRWGLAYTFANGLAIDAVSGLVNSPDSIHGRVLFVAAAAVMLASGISLVVHSGSTGGAFELLMRAGEVRGLDRNKVRSGLELAVLIIGTLIGGKLGVATLVIALSIGPLLALTSQALADHSTGRTLRLLRDAPQTRHPSSMGASE